MAVMRSVKRLIWIFRLLIFTVMKGALPDVSATIVIGMNNTSALFECGASATLRCNAGISFANWQIAYRVEPGTDSSAQCLRNACLVQNNFTGRYYFTYSSATGISDLQIDPVVIEDDGREYKCNNGNQNPLRATVKHVLRNNSVSLLNETSDGGSRITFNVRVDCTPENVNITWFSMAIDGTDFQIHKETSHNEIDCLTGNCVVNGTSKHISSLLELVVVPTNKTVEGRTFGFNVTSDSGIVSRWIPGTYKLNDIANTNPEPGSGLSDSAIIALSCAIPSCIIAILIIVIVIVRSISYRRINPADAPETPEGFELVKDSVTEESAAFLCRPKPYQPGRQEIVLFCEQSNNGNHIAENSQIIDEAGARAITLRIYNLRQGSVYDCSVFARSNNIRSENSQNIRITTLGMPDAPTDFRVLSVEHNCIHLSWIPGSYRMNQQSFVLELVNMKNGDFTLEPIRMPADVSLLLHTVEGLPAGTTFIIKLHAENDVGCSEDVGPIEVTTKDWEFLLYLH